MLSRVNLISIVIGVLTSGISAFVNCSHLLRFFSDELQNRDSRYRILRNSRSGQFCHLKSERFLHRTSCPVAGRAAGLRRAGRRPCRWAPPCRLLTSHAVLPSGTQRVTLARACRLSCTDPRSDNGEVTTSDTLLQTVLLRCLIDMSAGQLPRRRRGPGHGALRVDHHGVFPNDNNHKSRIARAAAWAVRTAANPCRAA